MALLRLAALTGEVRYANHAERILLLAGAVLDQAPGAFSHLLAAVALHQGGITEVAVTGDRPDLLAAVREAWRPEVVLAWGERYESPLWDGRADGLAYVCEHYACQAPQDTPEGLRRRQLTVRHPPQWMISSGVRRRRGLERPAPNAPVSSAPGVGGSAGAA